MDDVLNMLATLASLCSALCFSLRYRREFQIQPWELRRYLAKSLNLALCYRGFVPGKGMSAGWDAGRAAFYCCAYDVVTDWRKFNPSAYSLFRRLLSSNVSESVAAIAFTLYMQEQSEELEFDGLSRGIFALEFITQLIGSRDYLREQLDFEHLGIVMQIVDDVLDWKEDIQNGDKNCLTAPLERKEEHLRTLVDFNLANFEKVLPHSKILCKVIRLAQTRAWCLLLNDDAVSSAA